MSSTITFIINSHQRSIEISKTPIEKSLKTTITDEKWSVFCAFCKKVFGYVKNDQIDIVEEIDLNPDGQLDDEFISKNSVKFITTIYKEFEKSNKQRTVNS